jgi:hypothetical protein
MNLALLWPANSLHASTFDLIPAFEIRFRLWDSNLSMVPHVLLCAYNRSHAHTRICVPLKRPWNLRSMFGGSMYVPSYLYLSPTIDVPRDSHISSAAPRELVHIYYRAPTHIRMWFSFSRLCNLHSILDSSPYVLSCLYLTSIMCPTR